MWIDGRNGMVGLDPAVQNSESGIDLTILRSTFFRNFSPNTDAGLTVVDVWPMTATVTDSDFVRW